MRHWTKASTGSLTLAGPRRLTDGSEGSALLLLLAKQEEETPVSQILDAPEKRGCCQPGTNISSGQRNDDGDAWMAAASPVGVPYLCLNLT